MGLRASGKSTFGRAIAARFGVRFIDLDEVTSAFLGCEGVREAWDRFGEGGFRRAEAEALSAALQDDACVIALGGGTPTAPGAFELLESWREAGRALIVYLRCAPETLRGRLRAMGDVGLHHRPSLTGAPALLEIESVFAARDPVYRSLASLIVEEAASADEVLTAIDGASNE